MVEIGVFLALAVIHAISGKCVSVALNRAQLQGTQPRRLYWVPLYPESLYLTHRRDVGRPGLDLLTSISILSFLVGVIVLVRIAVVYAT
jgi:hypothetical protein